MDFGEYDVSRGGEPSERGTQAWDQKQMGGVNEVAADIKLHSRITN